jgi:hypothetical protein
MNCEHARELFAAELLGELDEDGRRALVAHHTTCATCRAEATSDRMLWQQLGTLPAPAWSDVARARSLEALREAVRTVNSPVRRRRPWLVAASIAAAFVLGVIAPLPWRAQLTPVAVDVVPDTLPRWVLLFTEPRHDLLPAEQAGMQVQAMVEWIDIIAARDRFISGEKLAEGRGTVLTRNGEADYAPAEHVTGFITVRAASQAEALAFARLSPVLDFGGTVLVLPVDPL